jgi:WD40 repeat protein
MRARKITVRLSLYWRCLLSCLIFLVLTAADNRSKQQLGERNNMVFVSEARQLQRHQGRVTGVMFSPDRRQVLSMSNSALTMRLWDITTGKEIRQFVGHKTNVTDASFLPNGRQIISIDRDGQIQIHEVETGKVIQHFQAYNSHGDRIVLSRDGRIIVTSGGDYRTFFGKNVDCRVKLWERETAKEIGRFEGHTSFVQCIALSADGKFLLTGAGHLDGDKSPIDCTIRLWYVSTRKEIRRFSGHDNPVTTVTFSPDGHHVLSVGWDNIIRLWEIDTGKELRTFRGHTEDVWTLAYSPNGKYVVSGAGESYEIKKGKTLYADCTLRIWEAATGKELFSLAHPEPVFSAAFSPDGKCFVSGSDDGIVRLRYLKE